MNISQNGRAQTSGFTSPTMGLNGTMRITMTDYTIRPLRTEEQYREALKIAERYFDAPEEPDPQSEEGAHFEALIALIQAYEAKH